MGLLTCDILLEAEVLGGSLLGPENQGEVGQTLQYSAILPSTLGTSLCLPPLGLVPLPALPFSLMGPVEYQHLVLPFTVSTLTQGGMDPPSL